MSKLVWNARNRTIANLLQESAVNAHSILIAVAFFAQSGWSMIKDWLAAGLERGCQVELFVGTDFYQTDPSALEAAQELLRSKPNSALFGN